MKISGGNVRVIEGSHQNTVWRIEVLRASKTVHIHVKRGDDTQGRHQNTFWRIEELRASKTVHIHVMTHKGLAFAGDMMDAGL